MRFLIKFLVILSFSCSLFYAKAEKNVALPDFSKWPITRWDVLNCLYKGKEMLMVDWHYEKKGSAIDEHVVLYFGPFPVDSKRLDLSSEDKHEKVEKWVMALPQNKTLFLIYIKDTKSSGEGRNEQALLYEKAPTWLGFRLPWRPKWKFVADLSKLTPFELEEFIEDRYGLIIGTP